MDEIQHAGMQHQSLRRASAIQRVADDGMAAGRKVHAQLVGAPGDRFQFESSYFIAPLTLSVPFVLSVA